MINQKLQELIDLWNKETYEFKTTIEPKFMQSVKTLRKINDDIIAMAKASDTPLDEVYKQMKSE
jgi:lipid II:glycine glycyltransferase (peptidoglycan interpeptide bridge formation enzyme)